MPLIETLSFELGSSIAKAILKSWLKNSDLAVDASSSLVDVVKSWAVDKTAQRKAQRQFEEIGEKVGESLLPIFEKDGAQLDEGSRTAVALAVAETLNSASSTVLAQTNLSPTELTAFLLQHPFGTAHFNETELFLYQRIITTSCECIVDIASRLPAFTERTFAEVLKRENYILDVAQQTLAEVRRLRVQYGASVTSHKSVPLQRPRRAEHFKDREAERVRLLAELQAGRVVTVCGLGGMGKTALVAEVLWTLAPDEHLPATFPDGLLFYSFYGQPQVAIALEQLARMYGEEPLPTPALAAQRALSGRHILLVLDGAEQADQLEQVLAVCGGSAILMTTRRRADAPDPAHRLDLQPLPTAEAVSVVQSFGGERAADAAAASQICAQVGNLPLALRLVGRYLSQQEEDASEYLAWLEQSPLAALDQGHSQRESIRVLLHRSISQLSVTAQRVFHLLGFLALAPFEGELVSQILELAERETRQALGELVNYGVLLRQQSLYEVSHPLLYTYARQELLTQNDLAFQHELLARVVQVLVEKFPMVEYATWAQCEALMPHVQACATLLKEHGLVLLEAGNMLIRAGWYLRERGRYIQSAVLLQLGFTFYEQLADETASRMGSLLNNLALLYEALGRYEEAMPLLQRALAISEHELGPTHPDTASNLNNLALLYEALGKYEEAVLLSQRGLAISEQQLGANHPDTAASLNNLAMSYQNQGKYEEAGPLLQRALAICEQQLGTDHPNTATSLNNLAMLYRNQGKYKEAESLHQRALAIREQQLGPDHPDTAKSLSNLAGLYAVQGKYGEAEQLYQRALAIHEQQFGSSHHNTASMLNNLAWLYAIQGKYGEAGPLLQRALAIYEQQLGPDHPTTKMIQRNYISFLEDLSSLEELQ
jgi:tetratricopeptide (TPR) repeat protein